jgi:Na+-transporting methylmalonyl-CoA/oxaloacetate decarboxylase gamma subunit
VIVKRIVFLVLVILVVPAFGQSAEEARPKERTVQAEETKPVETAPVESLRDRIRRAILLPRTAQESREQGVPEDRVREVLRTSRERRIPASDTQEILEVENEAIRTGAEKTNFGAAVRSSKESGLRGRELAEAIHAEQAVRGMKKPKRKVYGQYGEDDQRKDKIKGKSKAKRGGAQ